MNYSQRFAPCTLTFIFSISLFLTSYGQLYRSFDGSGNNLQNPEWGAVGSDQLDVVTIAFSDSISAIAGIDRPNPRIISNAIFDQKESIPEPLKISDFAWVWGQFIDHDITLSPESHEEQLHISIPVGDQYFDPQGTGMVSLTMNRSSYNPSSGTDTDNPRTFPQGITAFIDGSAVYGSEIERADWLRTFIGGKLKMSSGNLLPYNTVSGEYHDDVDPDVPQMAMANPFILRWFVAGDLRANENPMLLSLHTLFAREHNRQCDIIATVHPDWVDEEIYQHARKIVGGKMAAIVYEEWLPTFGVELDAYTTYDSTANPGIMNIFSTAGFRFGHTLINEVILRQHNDETTISAGNILLRNAFFNAKAIKDVGGIEPYLKGMTNQVQQKLDCKIVDDLRNFLFGPPGAGGLDLASLNINRGRERGLPDYNTVRMDLGLAPILDFGDISSDAELNEALAEVYGDINLIDPWVGFLAEDHMPGAIFGQSIMTLMKRQFSAIRDGDRYYYMNDPALSDKEKEEIRNTRMGNVVMANSTVRRLRENVFIKESPLLVENRSFDGKGNNLNNPGWGAVGSNQLQLRNVGFADGISSPAGPDRPNPRDISNSIFQQDDVIPDGLGLSDYTWAWGQFIDHDITLSPENPETSMAISIPTGDEYFDPEGTGQVKIRMHGSSFDPESGTGPNNPKAFPAGITAFIDASAVYGSNIERANWLRAFEGGKLRMSAGNLLPYNTIDGELFGAIDPYAPEMAMANSPIDRWFVAGDLRANENPLLLSLHTIFAREHNRLCEVLASDNPTWSDEQIYQHARKLVGGFMEAIVYEEWLPTMGVEVPIYRGYDSAVNPGIMNIFSTAAFRYGHTVINSSLLRMDNDGSTMPEGNILLRDAFFNPRIVGLESGIDPFLKGMVYQVQQDFDCKMIDDLRNFLFGPPGAGGLDLAAMNINRGRERGLPDYNTVRIEFGLAPIENFLEMTNSTELNQLLYDVYSDMDDIDPWVGFLAEDHMPNALFGETVKTIMERQFTALRDGDRFYYEIDPALSQEERIEIFNTRLSDIILRNSNVSDIPTNVFRAKSVTTSTEEIAAHNVVMMGYPNPVTDHVQIEFVSNESGTALLKVVDMVGKVYHESKIRVTSGDNSHYVNLSGDLPGGIYNVVVNMKEGIGTTKVFKTTL